MFHIFALLPMFLAISAQAAFPPREFLVTRQSTTDANCTTPCDALSSSLSGDSTLAQECTNTVMNNYGACYGCLVKSGGMTQQDAQQTIDGFANGCNDIGHSVNSITVNADGSTSGGSGSTASTTAGSTAAKSGAAGHAGMDLLGVAAGALLVVSVVFV